MSFSYNSSIEAWKPAVDDRDVKIRILQLQPLPWYLWWLPHSWETYIPLRASLAWYPLAEMKRPKKVDRDTTGALDGTANTTPTGDSANGNMRSENSSMPSINDSTIQPNPKSQHTLSYPSYKALSYTWGDDKAKKDIFVNGKNLTITLSLATALYHLRPKTGLLKIWRPEPLKIWIDQISINQEDLEEKTEQVQNMGRIYCGTEETLVWLGPAQHGSDTLMNVFDKLGAFAERFELYSYYTGEKYPELLAIETKQNPEDPKTIEYHAFCDSVMDHFTYAFFESLITFYNLPWFGRAWVVQEFGLSPKATFVYGTKRIAAETLMCVLQMILVSIVTNIIQLQPHNRPLIELIATRFDKISSSTQPFFSSRQQCKKWAEGKPGDTMYALLRKFCVEANLQATQGCDLVFGMRALANDAERLKINVDYSFSKTDPQVQAAVTFTKAARAIIEDGKLDLLMAVQHVKADMTLPSWVPDWRSGLSHSFSEVYQQQKSDSVAIAMSRKMETDGTLPSWVPDWRLVLRRSFTWLTDDSAPPLFKASNNHPVKIHDEGNTRILVLDGYIVDEIEDLGGPWTGGTRVLDGETSRFPHEEYHNLLAQVRQMCLVSKAKGHDIYSTPERRDAAHWMVPVGGLDQNINFRPLKAGPACKLKYEHCLAELALLIELHAMPMDEYKVRVAELVEMGNRRIDDHVDANMGSNIGNLYRVRMQEMAGKRPFISQLGYVGMGPMYMRAGDKIAIFNGASVPFIVRPVEGDTFRLMGECYCDGIMYGEFIEQGGKVQKIKLV